jgi:hypothetical protein
MCEHCKVRMATLTVGTFGKGTPNVRRLCSECARILGFAGNSSPRPDGPYLPNPR